MKIKTEEHMLTLIDNLIESLHKVMCTSTSPANNSKVDDNSYFKRRIQGFKAEIEFESLVKKNKKKFLEGGQFISRKLNGKIGNNNSFIYTTVSMGQHTDYIEVYKKISNWKEVTQLFYIKIIESDWRNEKFNIQKDDGDKDVVNILTPKFQFFIYNIKTNSFDLSDIQDFSLVTNCFPEEKKKKSRQLSLYKLREREKFNYFTSYSSEQLVKIYATRYFIDVILRRVTGKNIIDLDGFIIEDNKITLIEIKEKEPIKPKPLKQKKKRY